VQTLTFAKLCSYNPAQFIEETRTDPLEAFPLLCEATGYVTENTGVLGVLLEKYGDLL
jgi:hypothetical protein